MGGGSELSGRTGPSALARGTRTDGRERGEGWGLGSWRSGFAWYLKAPPGSGGGQRAKRAGGGVGIGILAERIRMVFKSPPREWGGAASCPAGPDRAPKREGRGRTGASGGRGGERVAGVHMAQNESGRNAPPSLRGTSKDGGSGADAERRGTIIIL